MPEHDVDGRNDSRSIAVRAAILAGLFVALPTLIDHQPTDRGMIDSMFAGIRASLKAAAHGSNARRREPWLSLVELVPRGHLHG